MYIKERVKDYEPFHFGSKVQKNKGEFVHLNFCELVQRCISYNITIINLK